MLAFQITGQKDFMNKLLGGDLFHEFDLKEATVSAAVNYYMDGHKNQDYFEEEQREEYISFPDARNILFQMIKGKRTPVSFRITLHLNRKSVKQIEEKLKLDLEQMMISHLVLNIRFEQGEMQLVSAVDYADFTLDKEFEKRWDHMIHQILTNNDICFK